jgi:LysM repeat protein
MAGKDSPQSVIESYKKRQQMMPFIVGGLAVLLVAVGVIILVVWFTGSNRPAIALFSSQTPTATNTRTFTPETPTLTPTEIPTDTVTPTITLTQTPTGPFEYTVKDSDNCWGIANTFNVDLLVLLALNNFPANQCPIHPGQKILVPAPGQALPTATEIPTNTARGTKIDYTIQSGDTLALLASRFNTTVEAIMKDNKITDANKILVGQKLTIAINMVTPTLTKAPTSTMAASATSSVSTVAPTSAATLAPATLPVPSATVQQ